MSIATFRGGVHPYEGKDLSKDLPIKTVQPKKELVFPMGAAHWRTGNANCRKRR